MQDQVGASVSDSHSPKLAKPALVPRPDRAAGSTALADPRQEGYAIPGDRLGVAPEPRAMGPSCVAASGLSEELSALQSCEESVVPFQRGVRQGEAQWAVRILARGV